MQPPVSSAFAHMGGAPKHPPMGGAPAPTTPMGAGQMHAGMSAAPPAGGPGGLLLHLLAMASQNKQANQPHALEGVAPAMHR